MKKHKKKYKKKYKKKNSMNKYDVVLFFLSFHKIFLSKKMTDTQIDFNSIFDKYFTDSATRKQFKITQSKLIRLHPDIFFKKNKKIQYNTEQKNKAMEILKEYYIPYLTSSGKIRQMTYSSTYTTKSGEVHTYTLSHYYIPNPKRNVLDNVIKKYNNIVSDNSLTTSQKAQSIFYSSDFPSDVSYEQLYGYIYRKSL